MNTIEQNKLIAEFMGFEKTFIRSEKGMPYDYTLPNGFDLIKETETTIEGQWCEVLQEQDYCMVSDLKFGTSWDWLMPVVEKIDLIDSYQMTRETMKNIGLSVPKIELVYEYVVQFIQWYNENKKP